REGDGRCGGEYRLTWAYADCVQSATYVCCAFGDHNRGKLTGRHVKRIGKGLSTTAEVGQVVAVEVEGIVGSQVGRTEQVVIPTGFAYPDRHALRQGGSVGVNVHVIMAHHVIG